MIVIPLNLMPMVPGDFLLAALPRDRLVKALDNNPSLKGYLQGYVAEEKFKDYLEALPGVSEVQKIRDSDSQKGDFSFLYKGRIFITELKSVASRGVKADALFGGVSGIVKLKSPAAKSLGEDPALRASNLPAGQFDILSICMVNITGTWTFKFMANANIPKSKTLPGEYLMTELPLNTENTPFLRDSILDVLEDLD